MIFHVYSSDGSVNVYLDDEDKAQSLRRRLKAGRTDHETEYYFEPISVLSDAPITSAYIGQLNKFEGASLYWHFDLDYYVEHKTWSSRAYLSASEAAQMRKWTAVGAWVRADTEGDAERAFKYLLETTPLRYFYLELKEAHDYA